MGDVLDPRPPQWARRNKPEESENDAVLELMALLMADLTTGVAPTVVQLAALRLVQKAVISNYQLCVGKEYTKETLRQATALAAEYIINGIDE